MGLLKIGGAALNQTPIDWHNNRQNIMQAIEEARRQGIKILCLPELCITGYGCEDLFLTDWVPQKALEMLLSLEPFCKDITVSIGLPIRFKNKLYNTAALISDGSIMGIYAKQFLANDGVHYEPRWFSSWDAEIIDELEVHGRQIPIGDLVFRTPEAILSFEICEDAWVDDELRPACRHIHKGVELILNPSASHFAFGKSEFRYELIGNSSKTFDCTYVYANLLGNEAGRMIYDGEVLIYHKGDLVQRNDRLSFQNVNIVSTSIDLRTGERANDVLTNDDQGSAYEFWEATSLGLFDYMRKSGSKGFVLSLSGGADSSACAIMVAEMVRKGLRELGLKTFLTKAGLNQLFDLQLLQSSSFEDQVRHLMSKLLITAYQATRNSGKETYESAKELAHSTGATFYEWSVDEEVAGYTQKVEKAIGRELQWQTDDITLQNIQARSRAPIIWMLANINNALLITTSNRSEGDVGYATMDGDTAGSIAPIAGVDKHFIRNWLLWAEKHLQQPGLRFVNALTPTAELRPVERAQTDEKDLMPYNILVQIERQAIRYRRSPKEVFEILSKKDLEPTELLRQHIVRFFRSWTRNQWKRERIAPSFHLDDFNIDPRSWCRFPILSGGYVEELAELEKHQ